MNLLPKQERIVNCSALAGNLHQDGNMLSEVGGGIMQDVELELENLFMLP